MAIAANRTSIELCDQSFKLEMDTYNYIVYEAGKFQENKDGIIPEGINWVNPGYYGTLPSALKSIVKRRAKSQHAKSIQEHIEHYEKALQSIISEIDNLCESGKIEKALGENEISDVDDIF